MSYHPKPGVPPEISAYMANPVPGPVTAEVAAHYADLCRRGRKLRTAVQAVASQKNGAKGGRPGGSKDKQPRKKAVRKPKR